MLTQLWLGPASHAQELRREKVTPALTRDLTRRPPVSSPGELALGSARTAMAAKDFATAYKEYRVAADSARGVAGLEKVHTDAVRGLCESGVKLAQQYKAQGKLPEAEKILREILSAPYNPRYGPALELLATLRPTIVPKVQGFTINPAATPATTPRIPVDAYIRRATPPPAATVPPETESPTMAAPPIVGAAPRAPRDRSPASTPAASPAASVAVKKPLVKVYFGTDRLPSGAGGPSKYFGVDWNKAQDPLITGVVSVSIPPIHKEGQVERPGTFLYFWERKEDAKKHFVLTELREVKSDNFYGELRGEFEQRSDADRSAFVYIHGFNVKFDDAAYATAQIVYDLDFKGVAGLQRGPGHGRF
jgi:hypothetical protein